MVHVEFGHGRERIVLVGDRRVDHLQHEHPFAGVRGDTDPAVTDAGLGVRHRHQRAATGVAEEDDRLGAAAEHLVVRGLHVDDARLVQAVGVVVHVPGPEPQHRVPGGGQERARVVHAEVPAWMRQDHRGLPRRADGRRPQHPADECAVGRDQSDRLATHLHSGIVVGQWPEAETEGPRATEQHVIHRRTLCDVHLLEPSRRTGANDGLWRIVTAGVTIRQNSDLRSRIPVR